ncbi:hypothetical protein GCM10010329_67210 [Streptomyces spiroverticillatus]|uniref:Secreted protein n=1 Tax=Streptomyces finlayi TaxID=67296 RepID=A0A919CDM2_9ACTN|nr:hypothetical protein [Streptomyces finlayi]GHA34503.1 hypothetical protein GCM10010329_67210 [Streptomyces spiroverticillatus]GHD12051.1 hypothetical protein GCM10010334_68760 [Streptomyces finlayi]
MPRGRHRHSPPLHKLLPPSTVAGASLVIAGGAWFVAEPLVLRILVAAAAAAAVTGAALMRSWDRTAGRKVAELNRAREADVWKAEERVADLEGDLEESRALRIRLENKLRAKRIELAGLRNEHAALLRRYATAETERATALERRRLLELEAASTAPKELTAAASTPTPAAYARAAAALEKLASGAGREVEVRAVAQAPARVEEKPQDETPAAEEAQGRTGATGPTGSTGVEALAPVPAPTPASAAKPPVRTPQVPQVPQAQQTPQARQTPQAPVPTRELREHMRPSAALAPYAPQNLPAVRKQGGFDFFGTGKGAGTPAERAVQEADRSDLADVVGEEALAEHRSARGVDGDAVGEVIDLTAHDETEQLDVVGLRSVAGS